MRNEIVDLDLIRKEIKAKDNTDLSPVDILKLLIRDIENGKVKARSILCLVCEDDPDGQFLNNTWNYRAGLSRERELALLTIAQHEHIRSAMRKE